MVAKARAVDAGQPADRPVNADWASKFKLRNAAKRRSDMGESDGGRAASAERNRIAAREVDPTGFLERAGLTVKKIGSYLSVSDATGDERYRINRLPSGHWLTCDKYAQAVGRSDNIALVQDVCPGTSYADAVMMLAGGTTTAAPARPRAHAQPEKAFRVPSSAGQPDAERGREYLKRRGISAATLTAAEAQGMLAYAPGAVLFVGLDAEGRLRAATARSIESAVDRPFWERDTAAGQRHKKHNIAGSKMHNAAVLRGDDPSTVWIVEGATDALSIHDLHRLAGKPTPTVIVSGGAGQKAFIAQGAHWRALSRLP